MKEFLIFLLLCPALAFSQETGKKGKTPASLKFVNYKIRLQITDSQNFHLPFKEIDVLDARFDTSKLGFELNPALIKSEKNHFKIVHLDGGIQKAIKEFYNNYYKSSFENTQDKLLIVFKTLWLDVMPNRNFKEKKRYDIIRGSYQDIYTKVEYYLQQNNLYYPLKRIDTVYQLTEQNAHLFNQEVSKSNLSFFTFSLRSLIETRDFNKLIKNIKVEKGLTMASIDSFNHKRFLLPVLTAAKINKGVFINFKEFAENSPSVTDYEVDKNNMLLIKSAPSESHYYWAYCDEEGLHISTSSKTNLIRVGNTFEFFIIDGIYVGNDVTGLYNVYRPRQIDMETGDIY